MENEANQRLDRFLKKYLKNASLSHIYRMIRKDVKVNGKRGKIDMILVEGDELVLYVSNQQIDQYCRAKETAAAKKQFVVAYEDANLLIVQKPFGLLTHGDSTEKKNTLANQVCGYLQEKGEYDPRSERVFTPSPVNRLDRNTTGLVIFGKTNRALQVLNQMTREENCVSKYYLTIVSGELKEPLTLIDKMEKDHDRNTVKVLPIESDDGKVMETIARPLATRKGYTLVEVELITGRTHQIRAHLGQANFPVIGDIKYGKRTVNHRVKTQFGLNTQLLQAYKLRFNSALKPLDYMTGETIVAELPQNFKRIKTELFD